MGKSKRGCGGRSGRSDRGDRGGGSTKGSDTGSGHCSARSNHSGGGSGGRDSDGGGSHNTDKFLWKAKSIRRESNLAENRHYPSYIDKLKTKEKSLNNARDAQQFFKILSRHYGDAPKLVLQFDEDMEEVLNDAINLLHPNMGEPLKLLAAMGEEAVMHGVYQERTLRCFRTVYGAADLMKTLTEQLTSGRLTGPKDHSTIAWFILQLGKVEMKKFSMTLLFRNRSSSSRQVCR